MSNDRASMIDKIKALLAKTIANGCTEAEANMALAKASAMMEVYEISEADLELTKQEKATLRTASAGKHDIGRNLAMAVARFTHTESWRTGKTLNFCGLPIDVDFATFLLKSLVSFTKRELVDYLATTPHTRQETRALINGFVIGCTRRINARLNELTARSTAATSKATGTSLAIVQNAAISAWKSENGIRLVRSQVRRRTSDRDAIGAGAAAGDRASFGRPVGHGATLRLGAH